MHALPLPESVPSGLEVWQLALDLEAPLPVADWAVLDGYERERVRRYRRHADRLRAVCGRAALRRLLGARLGQAPASLRIVADLHGKPRLADCRLPFNLAHSGRCVLVALGTSPTVQAVGVDVEQHDACLGLWDLAEYAFTAKERRVLAGRGGKVERDAFFLNWASKEAVLKAVGVGVAEHLQAVSVLRMPGGRLKVEYAAEGWPRLRGQVLDAMPGHAAALAWQTKEQ